VRSVVNVFLEIRDGCGIVARAFFDLAKSESGQGILGGGLGIGGDALVRFLGFGVGLQVQVGLCVLPKHGFFVRLLPEHGGVIAGCCPKIFLLEGRIAGLFISAK
jgi:hypothetical protein